MVNCEITKIRCTKSSLTSPKQITTKSNQKQQSKWDFISNQIYPTTFCALVFQNDGHCEDEIRLLTVQNEKNQYFHICRYNTIFAVLRQVFIAENKKTCYNDTQYIKYLRRWRYGQIYPASRRKSVHFRVAVKRICSWRL